MNLFFSRTESKEDEIAAGLQLLPEGNGRRKLSREFSYHNSELIQLASKTCAIWRLCQSHNDWLINTDSDYEEDTVIVCHL